MRARILAGTASPTHLPPLAHRLRAIPRESPAPSSFPACTRNSPLQPRSTQTPLRSYPQVSLQCIAPCLSVSSVALWPLRIRVAIILSPVERSAAYLLALAPAFRTRPDAPERPPQNPPRILYLPIFRVYRVPRRSLPCLRVAPLFHELHPLLASAGQTFRRPLSDAHVIVPPPPSPRASPPSSSPRPKVNSPPHPCPPRFLLRRSPTTRPVCTAPGYAAAPAARHASCPPCSSASLRHPKNTE